MLDAALRAVVDLHSSAEANEDIGRFGGSDDLLRGFIDLAKALDRHDLDFDMTWSARNGDQRSASLTARGRRNVLGLLDQRSTTDRLQVSGRVVALNLNGNIDIKAHGGPTSTRYSVRVPDGEDGLLRLRLQLGESIQADLRRIVRVDQLGRHAPASYELITITEREATDQ